MYIKVKIRNNEYYVYSRELLKKDDKYQANTLIILHGWNTNHENFKNVYDRLEKKYNIIALDFIGFGRSDCTNEVFDLSDYAIMLEQIIGYYKTNRLLNNFYLLGHSFGGRVIIKYLTDEYLYTEFINGLVLSSSAGIIHKSFKIRLKIIKYKLKKSLLKFLSFFSKRIKKQYKIFTSNSGSSDYIVLNPIMKRTMTNVIKEDLKNKLKHIKVKTLITWGEYDEVTPFMDAYVFLNEIKHARLIVFHNSGHFPHIDEENKYVEVIDSALSSRNFY